MDSDKTIHKAFRIHKTLNKTHYRTFFFFFWGGGGCLNPHSTESKKLKDHETCLIFQLVFQWTFNDLRTIPGWNGLRGLQKLKWQNSLIFQENGQQSSDQWTFKGQSFHDLSTVSVISFFQNPCSSLKSFRVLSVVSVIFQRFLLSKILAVCQMTFSSLNSLIGLSVNFQLSRS